MEWLELVRTYLRTRRHTLEPTSLKYYRYVLCEMAGHLDAAEIGLGAGRDRIVDEIDTWMGAHRWSPSSRCTMLGVIRPFLGWAAKRDRIVPGCADDLGNPRRPDPIPRALTPDHVARLLTSAVPDQRGRVIVLLMFQCGLRRIEVARLDVTHVDLLERRVLVHGKGNVERVVYLSEETVEAIRAWMVERGPTRGALVGPLNHPGRPLTPTWIGTLVSRWLADAGIKSAPGDGVSGHALRHTCATHMLRTGHNVRVVQRAMGHRSLQTTARYLRADDDEVARAMQSLTTGTRRLRAVEDAG